MAPNLSRLPNRVADRPSRVAGGLVLVAMILLGSAVCLPAQEPGVHFLHPAELPTGAIGSQQLQRGGPLPGFFQPVEIKAPAGVLISLAEEGRFAEPQPAPVRAGMLVGQVYRICALNIPLFTGVEVFPTIEIVDRLYTPRGQETRFAVPIELTLEDLQLALSGKYVTRVVYIEDPQRALPVLEKGVQGWFDVGPGKDPVTVADALGRPVAIVRMGARVPDRGEVLDPAFLFGCPPVVKYPPRAEPAPPSKSAPAARSPAGAKTGKVPPR